MLLTAAAAAADAATTATAAAAAAVAANAAAAATAADAAAAFTLVDFKILPYCAILSPEKYIFCFEAVFRVFAIVKMALDNLLKGEI